MANHTGTNEISDSTIRASAVGWYSGTYRAAKGRTFSGEMGVNPLTDAIRTLWAARDAAKDPQARQFLSDELDRVLAVKARLNHEHPLPVVIGTLEYEPSAAVELVPEHAPSTKVLPVADTVLTEEDSGVWA